MEWEDKMIGQSLHKQGKNQPQATLRPKKGSHVKRQEK
jgi:hypothetical protein